MDIQEFLRGEHKKHTTLEGAIGFIKDKSGCDSNDAAAVLLRLLQENSLSLCVESLGKYSCYSVNDWDFVDDGKYSELFIDARRELNEFIKDGYIIPIGETVYFVKDQLDRILDEKVLNTTMPPKQSSLAKYGLFPTLDIYDAAMIMDNCPPHLAENDINFWQNASDELRFNLNLITANLDALIEIEHGKNSGITFNSPNYPNSPPHPSFKQATWRTWCKQNGLNWCIPELSTNTQPEPTTDTELKAAYDKVTDENQTLRAQMAEQQKTIDDLRGMVVASETAPLHYTRLMKIAIEVQREHWKDPNKPPKQEVLIPIIKEQHNLPSTAQATAVEQVACPIERKPSKK